MSVSKKPTQMAYFSGSSSNNICSLKMKMIMIVVVVVVVAGNWGCQSVEANGNFGFDMYHRYSDPVKRIFDIDGLPEKGTSDYFAAMAYRDRLLRRRSIASSSTQQLAFDDGNQTYRLNSLGFLHYANVSVGTPSLWFLVALDTGSDLLWLPCDCIKCVHSLSTRSGDEIDLNIYSPNMSSTSTSVPCNSTYCKTQRRCSAGHVACPYEVQYLSSNTSSTGLLVEDLLHLVTDDSQQQAVNASIKFGCGKVQTGSFLEGAAPNGLFGLGMEKISVPSMLASEGLAADSFSMCFGPDGIGRMRFGDKGSSDQLETPFNVNKLTRATYNISLTQISVGNNITDLNFSAFFDSGTSFTYLSDPAYTIISESFDSLAKEKRVSPEFKLPFDYCYELGANQTKFEVSTVNLTMKGGKQFYVTDPIVFLTIQRGGFVYCLGVVKSEDVDIIGQNFMTGYNIVFDREKMVLGWKASDCYDDKKYSSIPINPPSPAPSPAPTVTRSTPLPPSATIEPQARSANNDGSPLASPATPQPASPSNHFPSLGFSIMFICFLFSFI